MPEAVLRPEFEEAPAQTRWGGCWDQSFVDIGRFRSDMRDRNYPQIRFGHLGFRLTRDNKHEGEHDEKEG
jgi:formylglycine-generating enzyme required for sulfatase activity